MTMSRMGRFCVHFFLPFLLFLLLSKAHAFGMMGKEKKAEEMTCDALMAKSLVLANEEKAAAESQLASSMKDLDKITRKAEEWQAELQATTTDLTKRLNDANERISHTKKESKEALEQKQQDWELAMANAKEEAISEIRSLKVAHQELLNQKDMEVIQVKTNYEKLVSAIRAKALLNTTAIQTETETAMKALAEKHEEELAILQQQIKDTESVSNRSVEETNKKAAARVEAAEERARLQISDIGERAEETKKQYEQHLAKLKEEMKHKEEEKKQLIADVKLKVSEQMKGAEQNATIEIERVKAQAKIEIQTVMEKVKETHTKLEQVEQERNDLGRKYKKAFEEIAHWETLHSSRSYCNWTYLQEDAVAAAVTIQKVVADRAAMVMRQVMDWTKEAMEPQLKTTQKLLDSHVQPQMDELRTLYKEHVDPHVQEHLIPFHKQYTAPLVVQQKVLIDKVVAKSKALARQVHSHLVTSYQSACTRVLKQLTQLDAPSFVVNCVNLSCQDATKTVHAFLWTSAIILVIYFRKFLWTSLVCIVLLPFRILWFFSPLRLFVGKRKALAEVDEVTTAPVKKEEPKKETTSKRVTRSAKVPQ